ncbi:MULTISPECIES: transposase [Streptomyces]|uniref:transposase n=1 Tax=Streptomyces TaxID=1883 RepID=UPI00381F7C62
MESTSHDLKKGTHTVGVQRQYTGPAGTTENAQGAVYLTYTSRHGHAGIDRAAPAQVLDRRRRTPRVGRRPGQGGRHHQAAARPADGRTRPGHRDSGPHGQPPTRSTATTRNSESPWRHANWATCSRPRALTASPPRPARSAPTTAAPVHRPDRSTSPRHRPPTALVNLASTPPSHPSPMKITIYGWSTRKSDTDTVYPVAQLSPTQHGRQGRWSQPSVRSNTRHTVSLT